MLGKVSPLYDGSQLRCHLLCVCALRLLLRVLAVRLLRSRSRPLPSGAHPRKRRKSLSLITVTDEKGRFVSNLDAKDFKITDEGKEQKITFFTPERNQPVVIGFLMDLSNASKIHWKSYSESAQELVSALMPNTRSTAVI